MPRAVSGHRTPRILLRLVRVTQTLCSALVLVAGAFSVAKFGIEAESILIREQALEELGEPVSDGYGRRADWRAVLLVVVASVSIVAYPILAALKKRRVSVAVEAILLSLWSSFMSLYVPTIMERFSTNCSKLKLQPVSPLVEADIDEDIKQYCMMSQIGVAAGIIVVVFTLFSILLLLILSYQSTDFLIERRAAELIQHHSFPTNPQYNFPSYGFSFPYTRAGVDERFFFSRRSSAHIAAGIERRRSRSDTTSEASAPEPKGKAPAYRVKPDPDLDVEKAGRHDGPLESPYSTPSPPPESSQARENIVLRQQKRRHVLELQQSHAQHRLAGGGIVVPPIVKAPP